jgi:DNA modification methylase
MPYLNWPTKSIPSPICDELKLDSVIYPHGLNYSETTLSSAVTNKLVLGDNLVVMSSLLPEYEGRIDLIYADPPFFTNRRYTTRVGRGENSRNPSEWLLAEGYTDHWKDIDSYLDMLYPRLDLMHRLLSPTGTLYLHLDWHANAYARILLDEIFGAERLLNELVWVYHGPSPIRSAFNRKHDTLLVYTKSKEYTFNVDDVRQPYNPNTVKTFAASPKAGFGKVPDLKRGKVPEDWWYFPVVARLHNERTGYPTQKPEALLERIILASSNPGDIVADFFCGSGTTPVVAARLDRQFIAGDMTWRAVHTTRSRLVEQGTPPFTMCHESSTPYPRTIDTHPSDIFDQSGQEIALHSDTIPEIDYWEIDPVWDGKVFISIAQAVRPRKKGLLTGKLTLPNNPTPSQVCVRYVKISGEAKQETF